MWLILFHNLAPIQAAEESHKNSNSLYFQPVHNLFFMLLHVSAAMCSHPSDTCRCMQTCRACCTGCKM